MTVVPFRPKTNSTRPSSVLSAREQSQCPKPPRGIKAIGIDLGTTNSVVSVFTEHLEQPETLKYDDGFHLVPSVIHWGLQSKRELVGHDELAERWMQLEVLGHDLVAVRGEELADVSVLRRQRRHLLDELRHPHELGTELATDSSGNRERHTPVDARRAR